MRLAFTTNSLSLNGGGKNLIGIFNFLQSVLNHPSMECHQLNHFPPGALTSFSWK